MECCDYIDSDFDTGRAARIVAFVLAHSSIEAEPAHILNVIRQADAACIAATGRSISGDRLVRQSAVLYATSNFDCLVNFRYVQACAEWEGLIEQMPGGRIRLKRVIDPDTLGLDRESCDFLLASIAPQAISLPGRVQRLQAIKDEVETLIGLAQGAELDGVIAQLAQANLEAARLIGEDRPHRIGKQARKRQSG